MVRTDCHTFDPLFSPLTSAQNPCFYQKLSPKVLFFSHCPEFWKFFSQRPLISWNLRKRYSNVPIFMAFVTERPPIFCLAYTWFVWGECCSLKHGQKLENFVFSKQNRAIWWILSGANLIKVMKIKFQFYRLNRPNCALWMNFIGGQGWYTGYYHPSQTWKGIYPTTTLYKSAHLALSTNAKCTWGCASGGILSVRCNAGPAEGSGKSLQYRSNLRLYPVNFGNKLCTLIFIILSIWLNFFDPPPFTTENFLVPPSGNSKLLQPPSILPSPPTKVFMNAPLV